jgi:uncharacterized protein YbbK (DUF523 family)
MNILVSACLLGTACRYDGKSKVNIQVTDLMKKHNLIPVCAEIFGGLSTPRPPAEIVGDKVINSESNDVTENYVRGAIEVLKLARLYDAKIAILKERSPSCGSGRVYDGTFSGTLTDGDGICARLLKENGITVFGESEINRIMQL